MNKTTNVKFTPSGHNDKNRQSFDLTKSQKMHGSIG